MNSVGQIITHYRKEAGMSQIELAEKLKDYGIELTSKSVSAWENGRSEPSVGTFLCVCRILGIWDCMEAYFGDNPGDPLSVLNDDGKDKVISFIYMLRHSSEYLKPEHLSRYDSSASSAPVVTKPLRLYDVTVSAGTGNFLDSDNYTTLDIEEKKAGNADFAVTISGDSMEPMFHNHEMVLVHRQDTLEDGEIGIFALNDSAYIKKFRSGRDGTYLVSLNPRYSPIPIHIGTDSFQIFGKVMQLK